MNKANDELDRFKEAARQIETDDDEARFNERLKKIAKAKPPAEPTTAPAKK